MLSLNISDIMSTDVTVMIITTDETAIGELKFYKHTIQCLYVMFVTWAKGICLMCMHKA